jgi:hypothetical protein
MADARDMERSRQEQRAEVVAWRASGMTLAKFATSRGYSRSSLEKWNRMVREERPTAIEPKFVRLEIGPQPELVVEVGTVRIRVGRGFDASLLRDLVAALEARAG